MSRIRSRIAAAAVAVALAAPLAGVTPASAAPPAANGCRNTVVAGAEIGQYPANAASMSGLRVSCTFNAATGSSMVSAKYTIHDFAVARYHNGAARTITNTASIASGATTFTATNCVGLSAWINRPITQVSGTTIGIAARTFVRSISGACLVTLNKPTTATIAATTSFKIDNANSRSVVDALVTTGSTTLTSATAFFDAGDVGRSVTGQFIADGTTISSVTNATTVVLSAAANGTSVTTNEKTVTFGGTFMSTTTRMANDATWTTTTITSVAANFKTDDIGLPVYHGDTQFPGANIPAGAVITAVSGNTATVSPAMTAQATAARIRIGDPSATAPKDGENAAAQGVQLDLAPSLVAGGDDCTNDTLSGFALAGQWRNPGSFQTGGATTDQPATTKAIGQILFDTSAADFAAFIIERKALTAGDPIGGVHYDVVFPFVPTGIALCASATSPGLGFSLGIHAQTVGQGALAAGTGKPGTAQLRSIDYQGTAGTYTSTAYVRSDDIAIPFTPAADFERLCSYNVWPSQANFKCGNG